MNKLSWLMFRQFDVLIIFNCIIQNQHKILHILEVKGPSKNKSKPWKGLKTRIAYLSQFILLQPLQLLYSSFCLHNLPLYNLFPNRKSFLLQYIQQHSHCFVVHRCRVKVLPYNNPGSSPRWSLNLLYNNLVIRAISPTAMQILTFPSFRLSILRSCRFLSASNEGAIAVGRRRDC